MSRKLVFALSLFVLLCSLPYVRFNSVEVESSNGYPVAPDFTLTDIDGNGFTLSHYRGKVVLLDFFATWCIPSVNQFYHLTNLHEEFGEKLVLISISPENETILRDFREAYSINWTIAEDIPDVFGMYNVSYTPTLVTIDQHGYIRYTHVGLTEESVLRPEIESLLPKTIYVDDDNVAGPWNGSKEQPYQNITSGLENAVANDTVFVCNGTYYENIIVDKTLNLVGENNTSTVVDGTLYVRANNVEIEGFCVESGQGIWVEDVTGCKVSGIISRNSSNFGILLSNASNSQITFNEMYYNYYDGICLDHESNNNTISFNYIHSFQRDGVGIHQSVFNKIEANNIFSGGVGLHIRYGFNNTVESSTIINCATGIWMEHSHNNTLYHNNFINNTGGTSLPDSEGNIWDSGYEGNYWSDYNGTDSDHDGIGDTPYFIDEDNQDNYPLMGTFSSHGVSSRFGEGLTVTMVSNSTISDLTVARIIPMPVINITASSYYPWNETGETRMIMFNLTGETGVGFCRMCIPKALMCPPYTVALNRGPGSPVYYNETLFNNGTHRWIYFTYPHSLTHEIWIIGKEDITHPLIANVTQYPDKDNVYPDDKVGVYANVTDDLSGVKRVILNFTTNNGTWFSKEMRNLDGDIWNATIPPFPYQTNVTYVISAEDNVNNYVTTEGTVYECKYQVIPEFPSFLILPLFMIATLLAAIVLEAKVVWFRLKIQERKL